VGWREKQKRIEMVILERVLKELVCGSSLLISDRRSGLSTLLVRRFEIKIKLASYLRKQGLLFVNATYRMNFL